MTKRGSAMNVTDKNKRDKSSSIELMPFERADFARLIKWIDSPETLKDWAATFFTYPLTTEQLEEYIRQIGTGQTLIFKAVEEHSGEIIGHIEMSNIIPYLFGFVSRVLIGDPVNRGAGTGGQMVNELLELGFTRFSFYQMNLGVVITNKKAIRCYEKLGFIHVGTWNNARVGFSHAKATDETEKSSLPTVSIYWMTILRSEWERRQSKI